MDDPEIITATDASRSFSELLHRVCYGGQSFVIKKGNRLMARIVPVGAVEIMKEEAALLDNIPLAELEKTADITPAAGEEDEYYKAVVEQLGKKMPELCE